jgi:hypothetical protein
MLSKTKLAFVSALAICAHAAFAVGADTRSGDTRASKDGILAVASSDIEGLCRDAQGVAPTDASNSAYEACVRDERSAYGTLRRGWARYSSAARETCAEPSDGVPFSYVELLTCLEMQPGGSLTVQGPAPDGLSAVDITGSPYPQAGGNLTSDGPHSLDSMTSPSPQAGGSFTVQSPAPNGLHLFDSMAPAAP